MSAYPWHIIGGVTADGLSFRTWRRGLVYTAEDTQDAKAKVAEAQDDFPHVYGLDNFRRGDPKVRTYILAAVLAHRDAEVDPVRETAIADFGKQGSPVYDELDRICKAHNGLWSVEAENYLLANADKLS